MERARSSKSGSSDPIEPLPIIALESRRHVPIHRVPTRIGIGANLVDHAAGAPRAARTSGPEWSRADTLRAPLGALGTQPRWGAIDAPVVLPLRRSWTIVWTVVALVLIPVGICVALVFASRQSRGVPPERASRVEAVSPAAEPAPTVAAHSAEAPATAAPSAPPPERAATKPRTAAKEVAKPRTHSTTTRRFAVPKRAPALGRPKNP